MNSKKDINAVIQPMTAPIISDNMNIPKKSPRALKNAWLSKPPDPDWYRSP